jgi:hypothetical protein
MKRRQYGSPTAPVIRHRNAAPFINHRNVILCAGKTPNTNVLAIKQVRGRPALNPHACSCFCGHLAEAAAAARLGR